MTTNDIWESFFNDPTLKRIIEEASEMVDSDDDPAMEDEEQAQQDPTAGGAPAPAAAPAQDSGDGINIEQLSADFQEGSITQDDLIKMYQAGNISKEEIQQIINNSEGAEEPQSEEELLDQQIDQTNDMFIKFALYDKIADLTEKLNNFKENFDDVQSSMYNRVLQLREFLNILSSLIFSIETSVSYQMYGSILLQLTEIFDEYNAEQHQEDAEEDAEDEAVAQEKREKHELDLNVNAEDYSQEGQEGQDHQNEMYRKHSNIESKIDR